MTPAKLISFLLSLLVSSALMAQSDIGASIKDSTGMSLPGANALLLRTSDSLLTSFGTADNKGDFLMKNVPVGTYTLRLSYLGFERGDQSIEVSASDQYLGLGDLVMYPAGYLLSGVEVTADRIPIRMKGDTMMYNADAFAVGENASVEDLLRRLPGMSIDANGGLTWRGQAIQQVMINGKPFFAGNATLITQNLDAKAIKNVEVFDKKTNKEELSGIDDGEENTTVNLEMKEEFKAKVFGEIYGGYGTADRYEGGGKFFRISDASQLGALGTINNVNRVGFSGDEMMSFNRSIGRGSWYGSGGGNGSLPVYSGGQTPGQNRSIAAGLNYGKAIGEGQLQLGYSLFDRELTQFQRVSEAFNGVGTNRETNTLQTDANASYSHRITADFEMDIDTVSRMDVNGAFYIVGGDSRSFSDVTVADQNNPDQNYTVDQSGVNEQPAGNIAFDYSRRLGKPGRTMGVELFGVYGNQNNNQSILTVGLDEQLAIPGALINGLQNQDRNTIQTEFGGGLEYEEPLSDKWRWESEVTYYDNNEEGDYVFRLQEERVDNLLTKNWKELMASTGLVHTFGQRNNFSANLRFYSAQLRLTGDDARKTNHTYVLPEVRLRLRSKKGFYNFRFSGNPNEPSISQLQTIAQPGTSGRVTVGNPELLPAVNYNSNAYIWFNDQFRAISANANFRVGYTDNAFGNELTLTQGQQIYRTVNVSHSWNTNLYLGSTIGADFINGEFRVFGQAGSSIGQGFVNSVSRTNTTTNYSLGTELTTELNDQSFFKAGYTYAANRNSFDDEDADVIKTVTHDLVGQFELELSSKWRFESRFLYRIFEAAAFASAANVPDLRMSLEIRPFKKAGHYFRISGYDIFDQNTVISRQAQAFVTSESVSNALGRYFLGTFHYKLR